MHTLLDVGTWQATFAAHPWFWAACAAFLGAVMASFGGLVAYRLPRIMGWVSPLSPAAAEACGTCGTPLWATPRGVPGACPDGGKPDLVSRSRCDACGHALSALALVPVLGWVVHRGRCAKCGKAVNWSYPVAEALTAAGSAAIALRFGPTADAAWALGLLWACVVLAWIDWRECLLPERITVPLLVAGLLASPFEPDPLLRIQGMAAALACIWVAFLAVGFARGEDAMSGGDLALMAGAGAWVGLAAVPALLAASAALYALMALPRRLRGEVWTPMGPAICAALLACVWAGPALHLP